MLSKNNRFYISYKKRRTAENSLIAIWNKSNYGGSVVKKVIIGSVMFMTGIISAVVLLGGAMAYQFEQINLSPFAMTMQILVKYGLTPFLYVAVVIAVVGVVVTILGLKEK